MHHMRVYRNREPNAVVYGPTVPVWTPLNITGIEAYVDPRLGITVDGSSRITSLIEQVDSEPMVNTFTAAGFEPRPKEDWLPTRVLNSFGSLPGILTQRNSDIVPTVHAQFLTLQNGRRVFAGGASGGLSVFWVSKHTSSRTVANHGSQNVPMVVTGDATAQTFGGAGFSGGELGYSHVVGGVWTKTYRGSGYNDGVPRLYGWTHSAFPGEELKAYVNGVQVGATATGITWYGASNHAWFSIGSGYRVEVADTYGGDDGFEGTIGPVIVVNGVISSQDLADLVTWCQSTGWIV